MSTIRADNLADRNGSLSTSMLNVLYGSAKAWIQFNGSGTVGVGGSYNVSSITDNGVGDYTLNFTTALPDPAYIVVGAARLAGNTAGLNENPNNVVHATTAVRLFTFNTSTGAAIDATLVSVAVFR